MISARPHKITTVLLVAGALLAGCGGTEREPRLVVKPAAAPPAFTARSVGDFFRSVTGDPLEADASTTFDSLAPDHSDYARSSRMRERYGSFLIYVLREPGSESIYKSQDGVPVKPDANGVYWHDDGGPLSAMKPYKNVVLSWSADERELDERFERLDAVLSQLGKPADAARAALPAADQPCGAEAEGTCRDESGTTVTTVARDQRLKLPNLEVRVLRVQTGRVVIPPRDYGLVRRAKGRFVLVALKLENTGDEPLRGLYDARLKIGKRTYDQSSEATWTATPLDAFPVQPGDSSIAAVVFDVPLSAARQALRDGVIAFPAGDEPSSVEDAARLGQIQLAKPDAVSGSKS